MKKIFLVFSALFFVVSVSGTTCLEKTLPVKKKTVIEKLFCSVSCSYTYAGITYSTTAGNWFSSCERASERCATKLRKYLSDADVQY